MTTVITFLDKDGAPIVQKRWMEVPAMGDTIDIGYPNTKHYLVVRRHWPVLMVEDFQRVDVHVTEVAPPQKRGRKK